MNNPKYTFGVNSVKISSLVKTLERATVIHTDEVLKNNF